MNKHNRESRFHIVKRDALPWYRAWGIRAIAIVAALLLCALITTLCTGLNPLQVYGTMFQGAFGSERRIWILLQNLAILLCISLAVTPAFKMRFLNRGALEISTVFSLNQSFADILSGIIIFFIIGCEFFISYKISFRKPAKKAGGAEHV